MFVRQQLFDVASVRLVCHIVFIRVTGRVVFFVIILVALGASVLIAGVSDNVRVHQRTDTRNKQSVTAHCTPTVLHSLTE